MDALARQGVTFALEPHPTEIAYDLVTFERALKAVNGHPAFATPLYGGPDKAWNDNPNPLFYAGDHRRRLESVSPEEVRRLAGRRKHVTADGFTGRGMDLVDPRPRRRMPDMQKPSR